jgi:hypothetical protein
MTAAVAPTAPMARGASHPTRAPPAWFDAAGAPGALQAALRDLSLLLGTGFSAPTVGGLVTALSEAPGPRPAPRAPGTPTTPAAGGLSGGGPGPFGSYWLELLAFLIAFAGLAARFLVAPAAWRSTAIVALLERPG